MFNATISKSKIENKTIIKSPIKGEIVKLSDVNDKIFSTEFTGKGLAIEPDAGIIYAPLDGHVDMIAETKYAIGITSQNGVELLIHVGLNTIELCESYFEMLVRVNDYVRAGDVIAKFDREAMRKKGIQLTTPVIIGNVNEYKFFEMTNENYVFPGDVLFLVY